MRFDVTNEAAENGLEEFVMEFLTDRESELAQLRGGIEQADFVALKKLAHRWKGFSAPYGFVGLGVLSRELEAYAEDGKSEQCQQVSVEIESYLSAKRDHLTGMRGQE